MKKSKKNYAVIALVVILIALAVGYAAFSTTLTINGTAEGSATWDVKFESATMSDSNHGDTPTISSDGKTVTVEAELAFPGDGCTVTTNIKNSGTLPAKLTGYKLITNSDSTEHTNTFTENDITVTTPTIATDGSEIIASGATCPVTFAIKWKDDSTLTAASTSFKIQFEYEQSTTNVTVTPAHGSHT